MLQSLTTARCVTLILTVLPISRHTCAFIAVKNHTSVKRVVPGLFRLPICEHTCLSTLEKSPIHVTCVEQGKRKFKPSSNQWWSSCGRPWPQGRPQGHILKSLALKPQVLEKYLVLGSRTALVFKLLKFCIFEEKF